MSSEAGKEFVMPISRTGWPVALALTSCLIVGAGCDKHEPPAPPTLVLDIRPGPEDSRPDGFAALDGVVYFSADDGVHGRELWRSDGTAAGTWLVSDIRPGPDSSSLGELTRHGGRLYFVADDGVHGSELWTTDGTTAGTRVGVPVPDWPGGSNLTSAAGLLYFNASVPAGAPGAWRTDGTVAGTFPLADLGTGERSASASDFVSAPTLGATFFARHADLAPTGLPPCHPREELWRTDGTRAGTRRVAAFPERCGYYAIDWIGSLVELAPRVLFFETEELWSSDGTAEGTHRVASGFRYFGGSHGTYIRGICSPTVLAGRLWFAAYEGGPGGRTLWVSDGTTTGTQRVSALELGTYESPGDLAALGGRLYFLAFDATQQQGALFRVAGVAESLAKPERVKTLTDGLGTSMGWPGEIVVAGSALVIGLGSPHELWWSDGTSEGTERLIGGLGERSFRQLSVAGDCVFFAAETDAAGLELWALRLR